MRFKSIIAIAAILMALPFGVQGQEVATGNVNLGCVYNTGSEAVGFSVQAMKKLKGGLLQLSAVGTFGEAANSAGVETGLFLLEGGSFEAAIIQGVGETWEGTTAYTAGYSGLFATLKSPWNWPGYDKKIKLFVKGKRQYPMDKDGAQESAYEITFGVSL